MKRFIVGTLACLLSACVVGPNYVRPKVFAPTHFKEAKGKTVVPEKLKGWKLAQPCDQVKRGAWWKVFNDPVLNSLEKELNHHNQTIANAYANYCQARAIVDEARSNLFPTLTGAFNLTRQRTGGGSTTFFSSTGGTTSEGTASTNSVSLPRSKATTTTYSAVLNANWEPDIWGLVQRTIEADVSGAQATQALLAATRLSAQGALAQYYFELETLDRDQDLLNRTVEDYKKTLQLTKNQYNSGVASRADVVQAQSQLEIAQAQAVNNGILRSQYEHAIAVLVGCPPATFSMRFRPLRARPPVIPVTVPSVLLERRPDVAEAERLMQQANAQIGVAIAAYFPALNLSSSASIAGNHFSQLLTNPTFGWSYGLQLAQTFFDGGLRDATVRAAQAGYMAQVAAYRQTVLTAFQDVEDNLVALRLLADQAVFQEQAARSAEIALRLVINQYKAGTVPYSSVITAQITAFSAQKDANDVQGLRMTTAVSLIKALGGGWSVKNIRPA